MAKRIKRFLAMAAVLALCVSILSVPASADGYKESYNYEWYEVYVQGKLVDSDRGKDGNHTWLVSGVYSWDVTIDGNTMKWYAGKQNGEVDLTQFLPAGYTVGKFEKTHSSVEGVNAQDKNYDNAIITVTI
ncbi:MAG: hypothetical protein IJ347_04840 [Faecalibacterium sp.]|nr:hypothetical protein [Faecalibacterium sp.]